MSAQLSRQDGNKGVSETSAIEIGRTLLVDWENAQPDNFFSYDVNFQRSLAYHWGEERYRNAVRQLNEFGGVLAQTVDPLVTQTNLDANLPVLERFDGVGQRLESVTFHPDHREAGRAIYASGMMSVFGEPGNNLLSLALFYLSSQNGEAGHNCPLACTAGLIKVIQAVGSNELKTRYLPRLLDPDYDNHYHGAQFLTEVQGGSDVGANGTVAVPLDPDNGTWLVSGEKWFCSNLTADLSLVTARVPDQGEGTRGLGLFVVPRYLDDGQLNHFFVRRLKEKFGTRSLATGEIEFDKALAYQVGLVTDGFKNVMTHVINTSRIYNAIGVSGNARRALVVAQTYTQNRTAFGHPIIHFPIVQDMLANMRADSVAMLSGTLYIVNLLDEIELGLSDLNADGFLRMAINVNKYRSAVLATGVIVKAIELLGGNGAIESFSILPRLLRDNIVYENWEGTHNVLLAQVQRDMRRYGVHQPFLAVIQDMLSLLSPGEWQKEAQVAVDRAAAELEEVLRMDELTAAIYFRPLMDHLTDLYYAACMAVEGQWEEANKADRTKTRLAQLFYDRRVAGREPKDIAYYDDRVSRLCR